MSELKVPVNTDIRTGIEPKRRLRASASTPTRKKDYARLFVECLLYVSIGLRAFGWQTGVLEHQGLSGSIIVGSGLLCLCIMLAKHEHLPFSFWFIMIMSVFADISEISAPGERLFASSALRICFTG